VAYPKSAAEAFADVQSAMTLVGQLTAADTTTRVVQGFTRYGAQKVRLNVAIAENGPQSSLTVSGRSDDIWGVAANHGVRLLCQALGVAEQAGGPVGPAGPAKPPVWQDLERNLTPAQKVSSALFVAVAGLAAMDVAWWHMVPSLTVPLACAITAVIGAVTAIIWVKRRYAVAAALGGAVAGVGAVWFSILVLEQSTTTYKLVLLFTAILGALPGVAILLGLRWLQDRLFPPPAEPKKEPADAAEAERTIPS
jgi:hypothetical protein